jgi:hypothetical protein
MNTLDQSISLVGAALILFGYFQLQCGRMSRTQRSFNVINLVGSALLTYAATRQLNYGVILLEGCWAILSIPGSVRRTIA